MGLTYKKIKQKYQLEKGKMEARELQRLRKQRISLEGKALRTKLKQKELSRISKAKKTIAKNKPKSSLDFGGLNLFPEEKTKNKKKKASSIWDDLSI